MGQLELSLFSMRKTMLFSLPPSLSLSVFHVLPWKLKMLCPVQFTLYSVASTIIIVVIAIIRIIAKLFFV